MSADVQLMKAVELLFEEQNMKAVKSEKGFGFKVCVITWSK